MLFIARFIHFILVIRYILVMNILYLDNDECLGYFGLINGIYMSTVGTYFLNNRLVEDDPKRLEIEALFMVFACELLDLGFARPGLKDFFHNIKNLKRDGKLDRVIMYTSASRASDSHVKYINWVSFLRNLFELYSCLDYKSGNHSNCSDIAQVYDLDHSGRSDEIPKISADGATMKSVGVPLLRLGINITNVAKIAFIDDKPENIYCDDNCDEHKLKRVGVFPYYYLPELEDIRAVCDKYDSDFEEAGVKTPGSVLDKEYDVDLKEFKLNGYPVGVPHYDREISEKMNAALKQDL